MKPVTMFLSFIMFAALVTSANYVISRNNFATAFLNEKKIHE